MKVLKFGGSSLGTPQMIEKTREIVQSMTDCKVVITSAFYGITDMLYTALRLAIREEGEGYQGILEEIRERHVCVARAVPVHTRQGLVEKIVTLIDRLRSLLREVYEARSEDPRQRDHVVSFGEQLSALIISEVIDHAYLVDAGEVMVADGAFGKARIVRSVTYERLRCVMLGREGIAVMGGFFAKKQDGTIVTMERGASDYSAAIVAAALSASVLEIWTDVNGILSADPKRVEKAYTIEQLNFAEALELSHFGAKVLCPASIQPLQEKSIPIHIKNTFLPQEEGTWISAESTSNTRKPIKGIASISNVTLLDVFGTGMMGITTSTSRLLSALSSCGVNVILMAQGSSGVSTSLAVVDDDVEPACRAISQEFNDEIRCKRIKLQAEKSVSVVAIVGSGMRHKPGISGKLFYALGRNGVNTYAIAQGASELNISFVIKTSDLGKSLNVIHDSFFLSAYSEQNVFLFGLGKVGKTLYNQINKQSEKLLNEKNLRINIVGLANSKKYVADKHGVVLDDMETHKAVSLCKEGAIRDFCSMQLANSVMVDCTASPDVGSLYKKVLSASISVVTANKIACSSSQEEYDLLNATAKNHGIKFLYETNVGAGLPILSTIRDLVNSGDRILAMEAVLSGTLNYIFNIVDEEISLSEAITRAREKGFSEPDPRIDLGGADVLRKFLILSRESGYRLEKDDVQMIPFLPDSVRKAPTLESFMEEVRLYDPIFEQRRKELARKKEKWRYVGKMDEGKVEIRLQIVGIDHPFYDLEESNNIVKMTTERYNRHPMMIKGYGAGAEVTAAGVFSDIMRVVHL